MSARSLRLGLLLSATLATLALPSRVDAQTVVMGVNGNVTGLRFRDVRVPLFADLSGAGGAKLGSYTLRVSWNPRILAFSNFIDTPDQGTFATPQIRTDSTDFGVLYVAAISASGRGGVFDLVHLDFFVDSLDSSPITVQVLEASAAGTLVDLLPSVVTVNGTFCPGSGRWGDLDRDGFANSRDALVILSSVVGLTVPEAFDLSLGDVDGDTKINSRDALIVLSYGVGLPITGQRILLVAAMSCSTGAGPSLKILPDTVDVVPHQQVQLQLTALGAGGRPVALNGINWQVADGRMATIDQGGALTAVDTGVTTVLVSIGPGVTTSAPLIVRSHRAVWLVDPHVAQSTVQLGNARFPFETPEFAFALLAEGDTIRIHPGAVDYRPNVGTDPMPVGAFVIGDTLADGTRPILRGGFGNDAMFWQAGKHGLVANLDLRGFDHGVLNEGLVSLTVRNVRVQTDNGAGIMSLGAMDTLQVLKSTFTGDSSGNTGEGITVEGALLVVLHNIQVTGWHGDGVLLDAADTLDMLQANVSGNFNNGLHMIDPTGAGQATVSHSRFADNGSVQISIARARTVLFDHNYIQSLHDLAVFLEQPDNIAGSTFRSMKDSIRDRALTFAEDKDWMFNSLDSAFIDSLWVENPHDTVLSSGAQFSGRFLQVKNSQFLNLYRAAFSFGGNRLIVDSSTFNRCGVTGVCDWDAGDAIHLSNGLSGTGLGEGPGGDSKGSAQVTNSSFFAFASALENAGTSPQVGPVFFSHNTVDSVSQAVAMTVDTFTANDNTLQRVADEGFILASGNNRGVATLLRNQITCATDHAFGILTDGQAASIEDNGVRSCGVGIQTSNSFGSTILDVRIAHDTIFPVDNEFYHIGIRPDGLIRPTVVGNRIVGGFYGIDVTTSDTATVVLDSNVVTASGTAGIHLFEVSGLVVGRFNNVVDNVQDGIDVYCSGQTARFNQGRFVGNGGFAVATTECSDSVDATNNYWGSPSGPPEAPNGVNSVRIATTPFLATDPSNVPPLAPRFFSSASAAWSQSGRSAAVRAARPPRLVAVPAGARAVASADPTSAAQRAQLHAARLARDEAIHQALRTKAASLPPPRPRR